MKYKLSKIVVMLLLVLGVSMSLFLGNSKAADINTSKIDNCEKKVASVKVTDAEKYLSEGSHPTLSGYLFAGWYTTSNIPADLEQAKQLVIRNAAGIPAEADNVYALFVPEHVLSVKAQVSAHLIDGVDDSKDGNASIRFVTTVDSLLYRAVGFEVTYTVGGEEKHSNSEKNTVYEYLYVTGTEGAEQVWGETPYSSFCGVSKFFRAHTISGVPSGYYDTEFHVKPYWITMSGDKIYGIEDTKTIEEGCLATISIKDNTNGQIQVDKTSYKLGDTVTLTGNANEGYYFKALKVNGEEVSFSSDNTYTFKATEKNYTVEGTFGKRFFRDTDNENWYVLKQDEGVVTLPNGGSGGSLYFYDEYTDIDLNMTVKDDPDVTTNGRTTVWFEFENGQTANFSVIETGTKSMIQMMPCTVNNEGWNGVYDEFTSTERTNFNSDTGVEFRVVREGTVFRFYIDWVLRATMDLKDYIDADTSAKVSIFHNDDAGVSIDIPFRVSHGVDNVTLDITSNGDGTIATDKETYVVGDTITLYGQDAYYCSAMKVNGKEVALDRNGKYSFIAKDSNYTIEATTAKRYFRDTENENWNLLKQGEGVVTLPNGGSGGRLYLYDEYTNIDLTLTAKDDPEVAGETRTTVWFEFANEETINFAVYTNPNGDSMIQMMPSTIHGSWSAPYKFDVDDMTKFQSTNGIDFRVVRDGTKIELYLDGVKRYTVDLATLNSEHTITAETSAKVAIHHEGDAGVKIDIPFSVSHSTNNVALYIESNGDGEVVADKASYVVGDTITLYGKGAYYCTEMKVNGNAVTLNGHGKYSFTATDRSYVIEATTAKRVFEETTNSNWNVLKQNEGVVTLPNGGSGGKLYFYDEYTNIDLNMTVKDDPYVTTNGRTTVWFEFENGQTANFSVIETGTKSMIQMMPCTVNNEGWNGVYDEFTSTERTNFNSDTGVEFRIVREGTVFSFYIDGTLRATKDLKDYISADTSAKVAIHHGDDAGVQIDIPFTFNYEIPSYQGELTGGATVSTYNQELFYMNKKKTNGADPFVLDNTGVDGYYYLYGTEGMNCCYRSANMMEWEPMGQSLSEWKYDSEGQIEEAGKVVWADVWAPEVVYDSDEGLYYMFFSATPQPDTEASIANTTGSARRQLLVAKSKYPYKDFELVNFMDAESCGADNIHSFSADSFPHYYTKYLMFDPSSYHAFVDENGGDEVRNQFGGYSSSIDPHPYVDENGDKYLFWKDELNNDRISGVKMENWLKPDWSTATVLMYEGYYTVQDYKTAQTPILGSYLVEKVSYESNNAQNNEAPTVIKHNGKYYMIFSMGNYSDNSYQAAQAVSDNILGPYRKLTEEEGGLLLAGEKAGNPDLTGLGHTDLIPIGEQLFIMYHRHDDAINGGGRRNPAIDEIEWITIKDKDGQDLDVMYVNGPTCTVQPRIAKYSTYSNIADEATVSGIEEAQYLTDGLLSTNKYGNESFMQYIKEATIKETSTVVFDFEMAKTVRAIMVYNSKMENTSFRNISKVEFICEENGREVIRYINGIKFSSEYYRASASDGSMLYITPGAAAYAEFDELNVKSVRITVEVPEGQETVGISEIRILGQ